MWGKIHVITWLAVSLAVESGRVSAADQRSSASQPDSPSRFVYAGQIVDPLGQPIKGVKVTATHREINGGAFGYIDTVTSDARGRFAIDREFAVSGVPPAAVLNETIRLEFQHADYRYGQIENVRLLSRRQLANLEIVLADGTAIFGQIVDAQGRPVAGARVEATFGQQFDLRRAVQTDATGRFHLNGIPAQKTATLEVLTVEANQQPMTARKVVKTAGGDAGTISLAPIVLPPGKTVHELFGMKVVDADPSLQKAFHLPQATGVLVLDPGQLSGRLKIGELQRGDLFFMVGEKTVRNFAEFTKNLRAEFKVSPGRGTCRVVYCFSRPEFTGTNTQFLELSPAELAELMAATRP